MGERHQEALRFPISWDLREHFANELGGSPADYTLHKAETRAAAIRLGLEPELDRHLELAAQLAPLISRPAERAQPKGEQTVESGAPSEDRLALELLERHGDGLRYVPAWGRWLRWDGERWRPDETTMVWQLIREILRLLVGGTKAERAALSAAYVAGVERLARTDQRIVVRPAELDADPLILNTRSGIVDLRTGEQRPHDPAALCTKITGAAMDRAHGPVLLGDVLTDITRGNVELRKYLQRFLGYCATGLITEDVFPTWIGKGGNGKNTVADNAAFVLGDYAKAFSPEVLLEARSDRHPTELAQFQGVRMAYTSEPPSGSSWNDSRVKALSGDTVISARFMRGDFFTFPRTHKTFVLANAHPALADVSPAIRRRFQVVPFLATFPQTPGPGMRERLRTEAAGALLAWIVDGAREWLAQGTNPPEIVRAATEDYLADQDITGRWLSEECVDDAIATTTLADLFREHRDWCDAQGHRAKGNKTFSAELVRRGYVKQRGMLGVCFRGLRLLTAAERADREKAERPEDM